VDASPTGLGLAAEHARATGIETKRKGAMGKEPRGHARRIDLVEADLETVALPEDSFNVILCVHYLQRSLFRQMERALRAGGMLIFETFTRAHLEVGDAGPRNPEFLLQPHELRGAFTGLRTIFYRELRAGKGIASLLAQRTR
jgi:SAM-dependent methyltransferase